MIVDLMHKSKVEVYVGQVVKFEPTDYSCSFKIPGVLDNINEYPVAMPLGPHTNDLKKDDVILIIKGSGLLINDFYYLELSNSEFVGIKHGDNKIEINNDSIEVKSGSDFDATDVSGNFYLGNKTQGTYMALTSFNQGQSLIVDPVTGTPLAKFCSNVYVKG